MAFKRGNIYFLFLLINCINHSIRMIYSSTPNFFIKVF